MKKIISQYSLRYLPNIVYMLQATEYKVGEYWHWLGRVRDFRNVNKRRSIDYTPKAVLLLLSLVVFNALALGALAYAVIVYAQPFVYIAALLVALCLPWISARLIMVPLWLGRVLIQLPKERRIISSARRIIADHKGYKIAVAGSYGKTTAKEVLRAVLGESMMVAVTPGNMNTAIGISRFARRLNGDEEVLVIELGEEKVGDVAMLCQLAQPNAGIVTGISAAHLATFGTMDNIVDTIFEIKDSLGDGPLYINGESDHLNSRVSSGDIVFSRDGADGWSVSGVDVSIDGTSFTASKGDKVIKAHTKLLGAHNIGVVVAAIALADRLGVSIEKIEAGVAKVAPFEHRMEPRRLAGAWVIDDTYNGNIAGVKAGLDFIKAVEAKRKIYVTPGLVEQGSETEAIHKQIGELIALSGIDEVVLMRNSTTEYIQTGLKSAGYSGKLTIVDDPLNFYTHLDQYVAHGDVVLMQNDWTDNYN